MREPKIYYTRYENILIVRLGLSNLRYCSQHLGHVINKTLSKATGENFNLPGHEKNNMKFTILEKVRSADTLYGRERQKCHIRKFNTFYAGINREP